MILKDMNMFRPKSLVIIAVKLVIFVFTIFNVYSQEIDPPICPIVYGGGGGGIELYWFYADYNEVTVGNNTVIPERGIFPSENDRQYSIFTAINLTPPYYIKSADTYIINSDIFPDLPGDQFSPIRLSVKKKVTENYYADLWFEHIGLEPDADLSGGRIEAGSNLGIKDLFEIYLALEWLPGTPTSPIVGVNSSPPYFSQFYCPMDDSSFQITYSAFGSMVGAKVLQWHSISTGVVPDIKNDKVNFEVLFSENISDIYSNGEIIATADFDSLKSTFNLTQSGYVVVKAVNDGGESYSNILYIDKNRFSPVTIKPQIVYLNEENNYKSDKVVLENMGITDQKLTFAYDSSLFVLSEDSLKLAAELCADISIELKNGDIPPATISSPIIIKVFGTYYPQIIHVIVSEKSPTSIENNDILLPDDFSVGLAYPNPFNSTVKFNLLQSNRSNIQMDVYNIIGQKVFSRRYNPAQRQTVEWEGIDKKGGKIGSGMYFVRFIAGREEIIRKAVLLK